MLPECLQCGRHWDVSGVRCGGAEGTTPASAVMEFTVYTLKKTIWKKKKKNRMLWEQRGGWETLQRLVPSVCAARWKGSPGDGGTPQRVPVCQSLDVDGSMTPLKPRRNAFVQKAHCRLLGMVYRWKRALRDRHGVPLSLLFLPPISVSLAASQALSLVCPGFSCPLRGLCLSPLPPPPCARFDSECWAMGNVTQVFF